MTSEEAAARARVERLLRTLFAELLQRDPIGADDDFFELGGHSMLATRLVNRIRQECHAEVPLLIVFEHPTPAELARHLPLGRRARPALRISPRTGDEPSGSDG
ncbi:phosphopantetheine-binding protein [Dactylosporangium sp. CA-139114]|uniref:phosphopantetheine-binding protein n=1 Tax=Dactylosporangium sp. CA-139114 TaxID=3239931 RepID=UPI003D956A86